MNQELYTRDPRWKHIRNEIILRDNGWDLGVPGHEITPRRINGKLKTMIYIHHIIPLTEKDFLENSYAIFDPENLISASYETHLAIHYGRLANDPYKIVERSPNDTCPWKKG